MAEKTNRKYKDSVFVDLFYEDESAEANENMPLRSLMYIGRAYEQLVPARQRYKRHKVMLPKPEFYTFYNGEAEWTKEKLMRLSDSYRVSDGETMLDLSVKVININTSEQHEILKKCPILAEYSRFVDIVRKHQKSGEENAFQNAVTECIEHGILADYLRKKGSEAINMLIGEYDYDMDIQVQREEAKEEGIALGEKRGIHIGQINSILSLLKESGDIPDDLADRISKEEDSMVLTKWLKQAI